MTGKSNRLELEMDGIIVRSTIYFGDLHLKRLIAEFKTYFQLTPDDNYAFFIYKMSGISSGGYIYP